MLRPQELGNEAASASIAFIGYSGKQVCLLQASLHFLFSCLFPFAHVCLTCLP